MKAKTMKKISFLTGVLCALVFASCNNEPKVVLDEDSLPAVVMNIIDKPITEAEDYLVKIHYARHFRGLDEIDNSTDFREYFRPEEILNLLADNYTETLRNASYEQLLFTTDYYTLLYSVNGIQQFVSPKTALANFRAWLGFVDQLTTDSSVWFAEIDMYHSLDVNDTATSVLYFGGPNTEEEMQYHKDLGRTCAPREDFYKALKSLTSDQLFQVSLRMEGTDSRVIYLDYHTLEHQYAGYPSVGYQQKIVTTDVNRRVVFTCVSFDDSTH